MRTAYRILRDGAQMMREHCAPVETWRELDALADQLEQGINPFNLQPHADKRDVVRVSESPDD